MARKSITIGKVKKVLPSGMVLLENGSRSRVKADVGDTLKQYTDNQEIFVVKAKVLKESDELKKLKDSIVTKDEEIQKLKDSIVTKDEEIQKLKDSIITKDTDVSQKDGTSK